MTRRWRLGRVVGGVLAGVALVVLTAVALLVVAAAHDALLPGVGLFGGAGLLGAAAPVAVTVYGPPLVLAGLVAAVLACVLRRRVRRSATAVAVVAAVGAVALAVPVGVLVTTILQAGGSVNPFAAVFLTTRAPDPPDERPVYGTGPDGRPLHLAVVRPRGVGAPAPVLVWVHGGGWVGGSERDRLADLHRLAEEGWLVVGVEYTLARDGRPTWDVAGPQVACALNRVAALAAGQGGDPSRVVLAGDSAGGQLAVSVGYHAASGTQASSCGAAVPVPRAIAVEYPAVDLVEGYEHGEPSRDARRLAVAYTGGTPAGVPDRYRAISGTAAITPAAPPTLVLGPAEDRLVPPVGVTRFVDAARAAGVDATLVRVPYADHAFDVGPDGSLGHQAALTVLAAWARRRVATG